MRHQDGGGGVGGAGGSTSSIKDGDGLLTGPSSSSQQQHGGHQHHQHDQSHHQHHSQQLLQQLPSAQQHRVSASLGELTPPGSAGGMNSSNTQHSSAVSNEDTSSNLVFSDLYWFLFPSSSLKSISLCISYIIISSVEIHPYYYYYHLPLFVSLFRHHFVHI